MDITTSLDDLKKLNEFIEEQVNKRTEINCRPRYRSDQINELAESLSVAQGEFPSIPYNRSTASWNDDFSDLDIVMKYVRPILSKNKLSISQWTELVDGGAIILHTELLHASGQWKESCIKVVPHRNDIKTLDSLMADYRRHQALFILGITLSGDPKDDAGEYAMAIPYEEIAEGDTTKLVRKKESYESITADQLDEIRYELNGYPDLTEELMDKYKLRDLSDMPKSKYNFAITQIRKFKRYRESNKKPHLN